MRITTSGIHTSTAVAVLALCVIAAFVMTASSEEIQADTEVTVGGHHYTLNDSGAVYNGPVNATGDVTIPEYIEYGGQRYTVYSIWIDYNGESIRTLSIPSTITAYRLPLLSHNESNLVSIAVDPDNIRLSAEDGILYDTMTSSLICYPQMRSGSSFTVPSWVETIGVGAFQYSDLRSVELSNVVTIEDRAFWNCTGLTSVSIPSTVRDIVQGAFTGCSGITSFSVDSENPTYTSDNGVLFNEDMTEIVKYPSGRTSSSYTIPDSVRTIGYGAFWTADRLTSVYIPGSVTSIGENAFLSAPLTEVDIPSSVRTIERNAFRFTEASSVIIRGDNVSIGSEAFYGVDNLRDIWFLGTIGQLASDAFAMGTNGPDACTVHSYYNVNLSAYSDGLTHFTYENIGTPPEEPVEPDDPDVPDEPDVDPNPEPDTPSEPDNPQTPGQGDDGDPSTDDLTRIYLNAVFLVAFIVVMFVNILLYVRIKM